MLIGIFCRPITFAAYIFSAITTFVLCVDNLRHVKHIKHLW